MRYANWMSIVAVVVVALAGCSDDPTGPARDKSPVQGATDSVVVLRSVAATR